MADLPTGDLISLKAAMTAALDGHTAGSRDCSLSGEFLCGKVWPLVEAFVASRLMPSSGWRDISTAPKDGTPIWGYLDAAGIQQVRWWSTERQVEAFGGVPENYQPGFYEVADSNEEWWPKWWMPLQAIAEPPAATAVLREPGFGEGRS